MLKTILVPVDLSANSMKTFKYACDLSSESETKIIILYTYDTPVIYSDAAVVIPQYDLTLLYNEAMKSLQNFYKKGMNEKTRKNVELVVQQGLPSARIIEVAAEKKVDLIVMSSSQSTKAQRFLLGSNTSRVLKNAPCMVLIVPPGAVYQDVVKIVFATDLTEDNLKHAQTIVPFAKWLNAELMLVYVDNWLVVNTEPDIKKVSAKIRKHLKYPKLSIYICTDTDVIKGMNYFMKKHKATLLSMYTHHRNFLNSILNPSFTKLAVNNLISPLLVIHEKDFYSQ